MPNIALRKYKSHVGCCTSDAYNWEVEWCLLRSSAMLVHNVGCCTSDAYDWELEWCLLRSSAELVHSDTTNSIFLLHEIPFNKIEGSAQCGSAEY